MKRLEFGYSTDVIETFHPKWYYYVVQFEEKKTKSVDANVRHGCLFGRKLFEESRTISKNKLRKRYLSG